MSRMKHSYVPLYLDSWKGGTADMPRLMWSVYWQICFYTWDTGKSVSDAKLRIMLSDLPTQQWREIVETLVEAEKLGRDDDGNVFSVRAMFEAEKAYRAWEAKSRGGKVSSKSAATKPEDSLKSPAAEQDSELEQDIKERGGVDTPPPKKVGRAKKPATPKSAVKDPPPPAPKVYDYQAIGDAWNVMATACGLSQVTSLTDARKEHMRKRIDEAGAEKIIAGINTIPQAPFLLGRGQSGWKANFDWLLQPSSFTKLLEGFYHNEGKGKGSGWTS